jgi:hypothetical protein
MPKAVADHFEARRGYANYYFNQRQRDRIWKALRQASDFAGDHAVWTLDGQLDERATLRIMLDDRQAFARLATANEDRDLLLDLGDDLSQQLQPDGSGGLLVALHLWRRLLITGPSQYGEVFYLGTAPWPNHKDLADVLVAVHDVVETRFYFDTASGILLGLEMFPDSEVDPCEIEFRDYREVNGRRVPFELEVRHGDERFGIFRLQEFSAASTTREDA